ncbi:PLDc N-terminal domain-containing protein [Microbacterium elymi]|uniref:PLDc N-terminal domain-containing protein n=1 Tax=Microbacterium elymi TaxID=2909587 RepID=A0ABY5NKD3_9MICO|nr:PLDc N-terminal domain-containing protein [Microbacterium elymi]UUT35620.1 PLDc N-terminal domain-containing protein [Microbacterium elymi]
MPFLFWLLVMAAMVFAVVDIVTHDEARIRFMPKFVWLILVILLPVLGVVLWFVLGREYPDRPPRQHRRARTAQAHGIRPLAAGPPAGHAHHRAQLADLEREIAQDRLRSEGRRRQSGDVGQSPADSSAEPSAGSSAE